MMSGEEKGKAFCISMDTLSDMEFGHMLPEEAAKGKPLVHFFWLLFTPSAISVPYESGSHASRLTEIIESDHNGLEMPLEDRQVLYYWMDANVPYYGTYAHARPSASGRRDRFADPANGRHRQWYEREFKEVYRNNCEECHKRFDQDDNRDWIGRYAWINLSRPKNSAALTAHLSQEDGGRGIKISEERPFLKKDGEEYQTMLKAIEKGKADMLDLSEADMSGFRNARPEP